MAPSAEILAKRAKQEAIEQTAEEIVNQKVLQHYAKTVYFNDLACITVRVGSVSLQVLKYFPYLLDSVQCCFFGASYLSRFMGLPRQAGDLLTEQIPFGLIYFVVCWISDRYMMRSQAIAKQTADDLRAVLKDKTA
ncbi:unnamed protein product [Peronospora belbahrii]|uniref:Uncharacterized protein n=1 Tax=Peronospora belbahrii TaxID=622444 RepID=A0AAU9KXX1_9STRA|nr:unnamed protein product [Peronospora belbahrii]